MRTVFHTHARGLMLLLILLLLAGLIIPGVSAAPLRQTAGILRIGYLGPPESDMAQGAQLAIDQINTAGGFTGADGSTYQLELVTLTRPTTADSLATDLADLTGQNVIALLGPDDNVPLTADTLPLLINTSLPVLTGATADLLTDDDAADVLFRVRAPQRTYSHALATYMTTDLGLSSIVLVQTTVDATEALLDFESVLGSSGITVAGKLQMANAVGLEAQAQGILGLNPEAVVLWGPAEDAVLLLSILRESGWQGVFAYPDADEANRAGVFTPPLVEGVIGVSAWSYAYPGANARTFLEEYLVSFGTIPGPLAAAAYDAIWYLRATIISVGIDAEAIRASMVNGPPRNLVAGTLRPADFGNGDLIRMAMVYTIGSGGGPTVVAVFNNNQRNAIEDAGNP